MGLGDIFSGIGAVGGIAGVGSALASWQLSKRIARRDIALEVRDLNNALNEMIEPIRQVHESRIQRRKASYSFHGVLHSSAMQRAEAEWTSDGQSLEGAINELDAPNTKFGAIREAELEAKLLRLKIIARRFQREREVDSEWDLEHERLYHRAQDARVPR